MTYGFVLILTLVTVGGVIAYIGDRVGMNIGRKKLTLFGLRPKHTSILVTIIAGVVIASASIGVLTIASQDVRIALFRMKEIQSELAALQTNYERMKQQRDLAQEELVEAEIRINQALASYSEVIEDLEEAQGEMSRQQKAIAENEKIILNMEAEALALQGNIEELQRNFDELVGYYFQVSAAFGQIREANIAFKASEVILTTVIKEGLNRQEVYARLEDFLKEVDQVAYRRSARAQESGTYQAIDVHPAALDFAVEDVLLTKGDVVVRAVSESNTIPGVPVVVYLENYLDQMVFSKDTVLTSTSWDPRGGVEIDLVILQILAQANSMALEAGMGLSKDGTAVSLPGDAFLEAIIGSRDLTKPVQIELIAARDTWRAQSPMQVYLKIVS
ncbi:MAG: DUF3084 domain-containing protein [Firmicutes bacterium]|nr:DUF3084 domain-containing protein [Bacillota bacterium]